MLALSKKVEYGLMALLHMSRLRAGALATAKEISDEHAIPSELLGKVLQALARERLIVASLGSRGGYRLAKTIEQITLGQVIEAVEGPVHFTRCHADPAQCGLYSGCTIREEVARIRDQLNGFVHGISLGTFLHGSPRPPVLMEL